MSRIGRILGAGLAVVLSMLLLVPPTSAAARTPIRPDFFGVQDDSQTNGSSGYGSARIWAAWCSVQPSPGATLSKRAVGRLGRAFALHAAAERHRVTVSLGHPPPWVFGNHRNAHKYAGLWFCGQKRSAIAFPSAAHLRAGPVRRAYVAYLKGVISAAKPYLKEHRSNRLVLQAWNEPNLRSGGKVATKIPGTARTWTQAAQSLREQERIMRAVAQQLIPRRYEITTPAFYARSSKLGTRYFRLQAKARTVDSVSLNFYTLYVKTPNSSIKKWRTKAVRAKRLVTRHRSLRGVPIWITETNHNLVNSRKPTNRQPPWPSPVAQRRLAEVTSLEAMRLGFAGIQWYQGTLRQTAVNLRAGSPATVATRRLRDHLVGRTLLGCATRKGTSWCRFSAKKGSPAIRVSWSSKGNAGVTIGR